MEKFQEVTSDRKIEKHVKVIFTCELEEFRNSNGNQHRTIEGMALLRREKSNCAAVLVESKFQ